MDFDNSHYFSGQHGLTGFHSCASQDVCDSRTIRLIHPRTFCFCTRNIDQLHRRQNCDCGISFLIERHVMRARGRDICSCCAEGRKYNHIFSAKATQNRNTATVNSSSLGYCPASSRWSRLPRQREMYVIWSIFRPNLQVFRHHK